MIKPFVLQIQFSKQFLVKICIKSCSRVDIKNWFLQDTVGDKTEKRLQPIHILLFYVKTKHLMRSHKEQLNFLVKNCLCSYFKILKNCCNYRVDNTLFMHCVFQRFVWLRYSFSCICVYICICIYIYMYMFNSRTLHLSRISNDVQYNTVQICSY